MAVARRWHAWRWHGDCVLVFSMFGDQSLCSWHHRLWGPIRRAARVGLSGLGLLFLLADDGISPDEFQCEAAAAHLSDCCPNLPVGMLYCVQGGCGSQVTPDLTEDLAQCIQQKSCDELMALGDCDVDTWVPAPPCTMPCSSKVPSCH